MGRLAQTLGVANCGRGPIGSEKDNEDKGHTVC